MNWHYPYNWNFFQIIRPLKQNNFSHWQRRTLTCHCFQGSNTFFLAFYLKWSGRTFPVRASPYILYVSACEKWFLDIGGLIMIRCWQQAKSLQASSSTILSLEGSYALFFWAAFQNRLLSNLNMLQRPRIRDKRFKLPSRKIHCWDFLQVFSPHLSYIVQYSIINFHFYCAANDSWMDYFYILYE